MSTFNKYRTKGAFHYQWYEDEDWYRWLVDRCVEFCDGSTLDVGCGDGLFLYKMIQKGRWVNGVDSDDTAIELAVKNTGLAPKYFIKADLDKEFNPSEKWDYLACINTIEHLKNPSVIKRLIKNNVKKGAIITTIDYQGGSLGEDHKFEWKYDEMMEFFKEFKPKGFRYKDTEWIGVEITK